jgi:hypothetical protein
MTGVSFLIVVFLHAICGTAAFAIEVNPSADQIAEAIEEGKKDADKQAAFTTNLVGNPGSFCSGWGFLQTKLWNIRAMSTQDAQKLRPTARKEIDSILSYKTMVISYTLCTDNLRANDDHMVLKQEGNVIQPARVSVSPPEILNLSSYIYAVQAHFVYGTFDPLAETTLIVIPAHGDKREHTIKLSEFP